MLNMSQINNIRDLMQCGYNISEIEKITGFDRKTIRKYLQIDDFSPHPQPKQTHPSILDPFTDNRCMAQGRPEILVQTKAYRSAGI